MTQISGSPSFSKYKYHKIGVRPPAAALKPLTMAVASLLSLPRDILVLLPDYLHDIEDYTSLASTCRVLRDCMDAATPNTILRLAATQTKVFFRPSPHYLVAATARELGNWARRSDANESEFALRVEAGMDGLMNLALEHCGITMEHIRQLHLMRFSIINPVTDIIDQCVGTQWYAAPDFWNGGRSDAYTISSDPHQTLFHLAVYGELFAPDFEPILNQDTETRRLKVETRLEYVKYCIPDFATEANDSRPLISWGGVSEGPIAPRRATKQTGPYKRPDPELGRCILEHQHNLALTWAIKSSRWRPYWKRMREKAGPDFQDDFQGEWFYNADEHNAQSWRQRMWEDVLICQGLEGLGMIRPELQDQWIEKVKVWRDKIAMLEREPEKIMVGRQATLEYPYLLGDLRILMSGYCPGT